MDANSIFGYTVIGQDGARIGKVDDVWASDEAGSSAEFLGVKTGWLFGKTHVIPAYGLRVDDGRREVYVPYTRDRIEGAAIDEGADLDWERGRGFYGHYGIEREHAAMDLAEERVRVGKREVPAESVRLHKVVRTERIEEPVELRRERIEIERVPAHGEARLGDRAFQEEDVELHATREEPVVEKDTVVRERVLARKESDVERRTVDADVRREDVVVDRDDERADRY